MRSILLIGAATIFLFATSCTTTEQKEEALAKQYCAACHSFPEPSLLDKETWTHVMPQMGLRMGVDISPLSMLSEDDYPRVVETLPLNPTISQEDFQAISNYYQREAPDTLELPEDYKTKELDQFELIPKLVIKQRPAVTMLRADTVNETLWIATRRGMLYQYDYNFSKVDSTQLTSPVSSVAFNEDDDKTLVTLFGIMDPNDQAKGTVGLIRKDKTFETLIDSLKRPVFIEEVDLNNDTFKDVIVCAFGNFGGALLVFENKNNTGYVRHMVSSLPGARKVEVRDFNNDGLNDILVMFTQGDEQISLYTNGGSFRFRVNTLLRFSPVWGSSFFNTVDFNKDGHWDIVYTNGDNADYSMIPKPYHGVRIYLNDGNNQFKESWFHPMHGCSMAITRDFDKDGDIDIATISFFPDFKKTPERNFVYFENNKGKLEPYTTPIASDARWLLMETVDLNHDGYHDILLGALDFESNGVTTALKKRWADKYVDILVLKNKGQKK